MAETLIDYKSRILAAKAMSNSVQFLTGRYYLDSLGRSKNDPITINTDYQNHNYGYEVSWLQVEQIGKDISSTIHQYFSTIQKVLFSCHDPQKKEVIFLIQGDGTKISLYLGIRSLNDESAADFVEYLSTYIKTIWPGTTTNIETDANRNGSLGRGIFSEKTTTSNNSSFKRNNKEKIFAITGIPSFMKKDGEESLSSIDALIGTLSRKVFSYVIIADPVAEQEVSGIISKCNEMAGQLESVKTYNFSESKNVGLTSGTTITDGTSTSDTKGQSDSRKKPLQLAMTGVALATGLGFEPFTRILPSAIENLLLTARESPHFGLGIMSATGIMSGFVSQDSKSVQHTEGTSHQESRQESFTEGQAASLSSTIVNRDVSYTLNRLDSQIQRFESGLGEGMWRTGAFLITDDQYVGECAALQLKSILSGKNSHLEPIRIHNISYLRKDSAMIDNLASFSMPSLPIVCRTDNGDCADISNPFEGASSHLTTLLTTEELSCLINFPQKSVPGLSVVDSSPDFSLNPFITPDKKDSIEIGELLYAGSKTDIKLSLPINLLSRHCLISGVNGSGKTNTITNVLYELSNKQTPFLVLEPAKTEYVDWALRFNEELKIAQNHGRRIDEQPIIVFAPGKKTHLRRASDGSIKQYTIVDELRFNPFEVISLSDEKPDDSAVLAHIDRVKSTFASAFPVYDILPVVMETVLYHLYTYGERWLCDKPSPRRKFPTLSLMYACIDGVIESLGYDKRTQENISAAMKTRINSLLRGWKRTMLNNERINGYSWSEIFNRKCVINLSELGDDTDRSFIMSLILQFLYEYRIAESSQPDFDFNANTTRHLVIVEEAHRVMSHSTNQESPQYKSGLLFSNMLSEIRAYGQGLMIVDQVPSRLIPDAIKNTNLKIVHRLVSSDDINSLADSMGLNQSQRMIVPKLSTGQAIISGLNSGSVSMTSDSNIYWSQIFYRK